MLGDGDVEWPPLGVALDLALLTGQAGLGPGYHLRARPHQTYLDETGGQEGSPPRCEIWCKWKKKHPNENF